MVYTFMTIGWAEEIDPRVERVRRDLGYYKQQDANSLITEIQAMREEMRLSIKQQNNHIQQIEEELKRLQAVGTKPNSPQPATPSEAEPSPPISKSNNNVSVCYQGCDFQDLQQAVNAAPVGGLVTVAAEINGTCAVINKPLRLLGLAGKDGTRAHLVGGVCIGKAPLVIAGPNISIEGFEISDIQVGDGNGACIRLDPGSRDISIKNLYCHDSQDGILGGLAGRLTIEDSKLEANGFGDGSAHGIYLTHGNEALIRRSKILSTKNAGHSLKSGVQKLIVEDSTIAALNGHNSRALDAYAGGDITLRRNVIQQGPNSDNSEVIGLALEPSRLLPNGHSVLLEDNWILYDDDKRGGKILFRGKKLGPIVVRNNLMVGLNGIGMDGVKDTGNRWAETRKQVGLPPYDGTLECLPIPGKSPMDSDFTKLPTAPGFSWKNIFQ